MSPMQVGGAVIVVGTVHAPRAAAPVDERTRALDTRPPQPPHPPRLWPTPSAFAANRFARCTEPPRWPCSAALMSRLVLCGVLLYIDATCRPSRLAWPVATYCAVRQGLCLLCCRTAAGRMAAVGRPLHGCHAGRRAGLGRRRAMTPDPTQQLVIMLFIRPRPPARCRPSATAGHLCLHGAGAAALRARSATHVAILSTTRWR